MAPVYSRGVFTAWSATCNLHVASGERCNKNLNLGTTYSSEEARRRIQEWCLRGLDIADGPEARGHHMEDNPRWYAPAVVRSAESLEEAAASLGGFEV